MAIASEPRLLPQDAAPLWAHGDGRDCRWVARQSHDDLDTFFASGCVRLHALTPFEKCSHERGSNPPHVPAAELRPSVADQKKCHVVASVHLSFDTITRGAHQTQARYCNAGSADDKTHIAASLLSPRIDRLWRTSDEHHSSTGHSAAGDCAQGARLAHGKAGRKQQAAHPGCHMVATTGESVRNLPHMMPSAATFARAASEHGIEPETHVVVYDTHGVFSAPRTAFTFKAFGHSNVSVLNGGLPAWINHGLPTEEGEPSSVAKTDYPEHELQDGIIRSFDEMVANAKMGARGQTVFDARSKGRFDGSDPEPRPGLSSGHIPHSLSLPFPTLLKTETGKDGKTYTVLKDQIELWRRLGDTVGGTEALDKLRQASSGGELAATNTCGSGMTAAAIWLALQEIGVQSSIYDESWMGWASRESEGVPIDKNA
ncbi:hypothetical protein L1887_61617 [Cichorium endivia]|nr:hypothetical protein L1887_61617 [Cichorium endivia]